MYNMEQNDAEKRKCGLCSTHYQIQETQAEEERKRITVILEVNSRHFVKCGEKQFEGLSGLNNQQSNYWMFLQMTVSES